MKRKTQVLKGYLEQDRLNLWTRCLLFCSVEHARLGFVRLSRDEKYGQNLTYRHMNDARTYQAPNPKNFRIMLPTCEVALRETFL